MMSPEKRRAIVLLFLIGIILIQCFVIWTLWDLTGELQESIDELEAKAFDEQWRNYVEDAIIIAPAQNVSAGNAVRRLRSLTLAHPPAVAEQFGKFFRESVLWWRGQ